MMKNKILPLAIMLVISFFSLADEVKPSIKDSHQSISLININQADQQALSLLKGVGKKKAQAIIEFRENNGNFNSIEELLNVKGIGREILESNRSRLTI